MFGEFASRPPSSFFPDMISHDDDGEDRAGHMGGHPWDAFNPNMHTMKLVK